MQAVIPLAFKGQDLFSQTSVYASDDLQLRLTDSMMQMPVHKACPVILRQRTDGCIEILAFKRPVAGKQLIKGTIEQEEYPEDAALRELAEESGITNAFVSRKLGILEFPDYQQIWHFFVCEAKDLEDQWLFFTQDDGGREFQFFWHQIDDSANDAWHTIFHSALDHIQQQLKRYSC